MGFQELSLKKDLDITGKIYNKAVNGLSLIILC